MRMHLVIGPRKFWYTQYDVVIVFALSFWMLSVKCVWQIETFVKIPFRGPFSQVLPSNKEMYINIPTIEKFSCAIETQTIGYDAHT